MPLMVDVDDVRIFTQVVDSGSLTRAALVLDLPKSTVSRRLSKLEDALNVRLMQRTTRKLNLTPAGQLYYSRTARIMTDLNEAEQALLEMEDGPRGLLRITVPGDIGGTIPNLLMAFQEEYPLVQLSIFATGRRVDLVAEGVDLALRAGALMDSSLVSRKLMSTTFRIFASPSYLKKFGEPQKLAQLAEHRCLIFGLGVTHDVWKCRGPEGEQEVSVSGTLASNDFSLLRAAAVRGMGIGYLPSRTDPPRSAEEQNREEQPRLINILPEYSSYESGLYAVYPSPRHLSPKVRAFIDFAANWLKLNSTVI